MNYIVAIIDFVVGFAQTEEAAKAMEACPRKAIIRR